MNRRGENKRSVFESPVSYSFLRELQDGVTTRGFLLSRPDVDKQLKEKKLRICSTPIDDTFKFIELERKRSKPTPEKKVTFTECSSQEKGRKFVDILLLKRNEPHNLKGIRTSNIHHLPITD